MESFVFNSLGRIVFPANVFPDLDFSVFESLDQFSQVIRRDFDTKAPTGTDIRTRAETGAYGDRFELLTDLVLNLFWVNRFTITMYEKRPTRWRDVPRYADDLYLSMLTPWEDGDRKVAAVAHAYGALPPRWDAAAEGAIFDIIFDVFRHKRHHATELPAIKPTVAELVRDRDALTLVLRSYTPTSPGTRTRRSSTARVRSQSSKRCSGARWCCTTSTRGTASRHASRVSMRSTTTSSSCSSRRARARSRSSSGG